MLTVLPEPGQLTVNQYREARKAYSAFMEFYDQPENMDIPSEVLELGKRLEDHQRELEKRQESVEDGKIIQIRKIRV